MFFEWPVIPPGGLDQSSPSPSWGAALQPPEIQRVRLGGNACVLLRKAVFDVSVTWNLRGLLGSPSSSQSSREKKHNYLTRLTRSNDIICLQEVHGKGELLQATFRY